MKQKLETTLENIRHLLMQEERNSSPETREKFSKLSELFVQLQDQVKAQDAQDVAFIVDSLGIGIWKWDLITDSIVWDKNMFRLYGCDPNNFSGAYDAWENSLSAETKAKIVKEAHIAVAGGKSFDTTFQVVQQSTGKIQEVRTRAFVIRDSSGKPVKMWGVNIDRTLEAELEQKLNSTAEFLQQTGEMAKVGGWDLDLKTGKVELTRQAQIIHEIDENYSTPLYSTGSEWYPPESWPIIKAAVETAIKDNISYDLESQFITAKGKSIWVRVQGFPVKENGKVSRIRGTFQDITEQKLVRDRSEIYKAVIDNATDLVGIADLTMKHIYMNPYGRHLLGLPADQDIGATKMEECYPEDQRATVVSDVVNGMTMKGIWNGETDFRNFTTNEKIAVSDTHFTVRSHRTKEVLGFANIARNISKEKELRLALETERLRTIKNAKLASLGEMSAGIAHEINNPLAIISGTADLLSKYKDDPEKLASKIETIQKSCDRIAKIVRGLKKFSRSSEKGNYLPHNLADIIHEAAVLTESKSKSHNTTVIMDCETQALINCDEVEIEQVIINLIHNGIDAVRDRIDKWVKVSVFEDAGTVVMRVMDSGTGISSAVQEKLFQPFFTTKAVGEGTGLGLSIAKGILDEHWATISVLADVPHTCFEIRFAKVEGVKNAD